MRNQSVSIRQRPVMFIAACAVILFSLGAWNPARAAVTFTPITEGPVVEDEGNNNGGAWGDYDNDGFADLVVLKTGEVSELRLYHNNGDGTFSKVTGQLSIPSTLEIIGVAWIDSDNDGNLDLFVATDDFSKDVFFRNNGDATFTEVTEGDWVNTQADGQNVFSGDFDNDGLIDLYLTVDGDENLLYHNSGDGTMAAVTTAANSDLGESHGAVPTDYDGDGDLDLFVAGQRKVQFRNDGDLAFTWISPENGGIPSLVDSVYVDVLLNSADYDNDGDLDLVHTAWAEEGPPVLLYRNDGESGFVDVTDRLPSAGEGGFDAMGATWGDYDNDGHLDLYITAGSTAGSGQNVLYHNEGDGSFALVTEGPGLDSSLSSSSCAWVDYDNDGDLDLFVVNGIFGEPQSCELFRNDGEVQNWIGLKLYGILSNRMAIGAKVRVTATIDAQEVTQLREVTDWTSLSVHFGLGDADTVESIRIEWPSGEVQEMQDVAANQYLSVDEMGMGAKLANISTRGQVGTGDNVLIAGLVVTGSTPRQVLIRASGATLADFGVTDVLADTVLTLFDADGAEVATNTDWGDADNAAAVAAAAMKIGAFEFPADSTDSAILITLEPGAYTAQVSGNGGATGNAIVEVYSMD